MCAKTIVYSCSGCSSAAQMANHLALQLDRKGAARMSCIAGIGGGVEPLVKMARQARTIICIDGCPLRCAAKCLQREGLASTIHYDLSHFGVAKEYHRDFDLQEADLVEFRILQDLRFREETFVS